MARVACFINPGAVLADSIALAARADTLGYDSVWCTHGPGRDAFLVLAAYGAVARRVGLGSGVIPIYPRHPVLMAQEALTLADISEGRLRLGIGVSHAPMVSHALLGEWKRGALFSVPPTVASMGMLALLGARPHTVAGGPSAYQYAFSSLLALTVFSSMVGVFDVLSFADRKERSDLVLAPVLDGREIGVRARGAF